MVYYGDKRISVSNTITKVVGTLSRNHAAFAPGDKTHRRIIVTSLSTLQARHGPSELKKHRIQNGWSSIAAADAYHVQDKDWHSDLSGLFDTIAIDEAHCIKNDTTASHSTVRWLESSFSVLATASVLPNRITDFQGYIPFIEADSKLWSDDNLRKWGIDDKVNPYTLPDDHPGAVLRMTSKAMLKYIIHLNDTTKAGIYLGQVWAKCMIRRTYASPNPRFPSRIVGEGIASLYSRRVPCKFTGDEMELYIECSKRPLSKLMTLLADGTLVWNRKYSRQLILNSTWLGFHYIGDDVHAESIKKWKDPTMPNLLYRWVRLLHQRMVEKNASDKWDMPAPNDIPGLLAVVCRGSPKLRVTLRIIAELVILHKKKWIIWCALPANQLLLYACLQALNI
jgi:hypothetical protein